jgi:UDP-N-acetylglucosamine diphosphorylase/glucosamine-1-phosphate N-acetyltransferase
MQILLHDTDIRDYLLPLTFTRPASELRTGILTLREKWQKRLEAQYSWSTADYLSELYPGTASPDLVINGAVCASDELVDAVAQLKPGQSLVHGQVYIAQRVEEGFDGWTGAEKVEFRGELNYIDRPWKLFLSNGAELDRDFELITRGRTSAPLSSTNRLLGERLFLEEGAVSECATFNTTEGPVYLAKDSLVMEGALVRGGLSLGEHSQLKMAAKIYGPVTVGPWCKVGGEVGNSVILGYSNKGHDGYLGNAVIGEWCNLGADTNNSNLKNNYDEVRVWSYAKQGFERTGLQFCGLIMGDHSKCGINTMFNTGTVVGVMCNIFGSGFPRTYIPSFSWGGAGGYSVYKLEKALDTARRVLQRRNMELSEAESKILEHVFNLTAEWRVKP